MLFGKLQRVIDAANGQHADGTAGAMHEIHVLRHQILHAIAEDRMRMAAAELHDVVAAGGMRLAPDRGGEPLGQLPVAEFVDIFHCAASPAKPIKLAFLSGFADHGERAFSLLGRNFVERVAHMDQHEFARLHAVEEGDRDLLLDGAERHDGGFGGRIDGDDLSGNGKAHG